ncbi:aminotransferase class V-fold PLP-dependent enzyme [bacterium]|nr:MAG: aminotransferase class V-fold PLP-dependent enzyme [bacterium]
MPEPLAPAFSFFGIISSRKSAVYTLMSFSIPSGADFFEWRRQQFPFFKSRICLTHAAVSPLPAVAVTALQNYTASLGNEGQFHEPIQPTYDLCKERIARLLNNGARPEEIAFAGSTSHALGLVATSYPWQPGDNCVVFDGDFPANVVIWKNLAHTHGVEVRVVPFKPARDFTPDDLAPYVDERTRIVTLSAVNFVSGYALDLRAFGELIHSRGALMCVDGIQALGAIQLDLTEADFVCADAHKWMLGPNGAAFAWFKAEVLPRMRPQILGWLAIESRDDWFSYGTQPIATAERFEPGARNYLGIVGMEASLALLEEVGMDEVSRRVTHLRDYIAGKLAALGCELRWTPDGHNKSGIVSFRPPSGDINALNAHLEERFALSLRNDRDGRPWIRASPHWMNTESDLDDLAETISKYLTS